MYPVICRIGPFTIYSYGVFVTLGFASGIIFFLRQAKRENLKQEEMFSFLFWIVVSAIIGARVFYVLNHLTYFLRNPQDTLKIWRGGLVLYGGFIFSLAGGTLFIKWHRLSFWKIANLSAPCIALGISIGRIGCLLNGCCYGKPWDKGFVFSLSSPAGKAFPNQPLIPTQLISSIDLLAIFFVLILLKGRQWFSNKSFLWFLIFYSIHRFIIEFLRADSPEIFLNLTFSQLVSIIMGTSALVLVRSLKIEG